MASLLVLFLARARDAAHAQACTRGRRCLHACACPPERERGVALGHFCEASHESVHTANMPRPEPSTNKIQACRRKYLVFPSQISPLDGTDVASVRPILYLEPICDNGVVYPWVFGGFQIWPHFGDSGRLPSEQVFWRFGPIGPPYFGDFEKSDRKFARRAARDNGRDMQKLLRNIQ
jgi:hypothetical protein